MNYLFRERGNLHRTVFIPMKGIQKETNEMVYKLDIKNIYEIRMFHKVHLVTALIPMLCTCIPTETSYHT